MCNCPVSQMIKILTEGTEGVISSEPAFTECQV